MRIFHYITVLFLSLTLGLITACGGGGQDPVKQLDGLVTMVEAKSGSMTDAQLQQSVGRYNGLVSAINRRYGSYSPMQLEKAENLCRRFKTVVGRKCSEAVLIVLKPSEGGSLADMEKEVVGRAAGSSSASVPEAVGNGKTVPPSGRSEMGGDEIFEKYGSAVFIITLTEGMVRTQGSGFFISPDGLAVSNYHVFKGSKKGSESITLADGKSYKVKKVIGKGHCDGDGLRPDDFMLFRVDIGNQSVNYIPVARELARVGQKVYAVGSPRGFENTFSSGEISQIRKVDDGFLYQISVPIDHGSSGGVLLNGYGEAIGITTGGFDDSGANLNFAVDIHVIDKYIN